MCSSDLGVASAPLGSTQESGDVHVVQEFAHGCLVAVADGLGHGAEAALAAKRCVTLLREHAGIPLEELLTRCHMSLRGTRGAAVGVAVFTTSDSTMSWLGVGNVVAVLLDGARGPSGRHVMLQRGGVVGDSLPRLSATRFRVRPGDTLVLATDGIRENFQEAMSPDGAPQRIADEVLARHAKGTDDALVLVVRYLGIST